MWMGVCQLGWRLPVARMGSSSVLREVCGSSLSPPCFQEQTSYCRHTPHFIRLTSCEPAGHSNNRNKLESQSFLSGLHVLSGARGAEESLSVHFDARQSCISQTPVNGALTDLLSTESLGLGLRLSRIASLGGLPGHNGNLRTLKSFDPMSIQPDGQYLLPSAAEVLLQPVLKTFPSAQYCFFPF